MVRWRLLPPAVRRRGQGRRGGGAREGEEPRGRQALPDSGQGLQRAAEHGVAILSNGGAFARPRDGAQQGLERAGIHDDRWGAGVGGP